MISNYLSPILVTGSHYSGSTWVGKMLSLSSDIGYIHEPFNPHFNNYRKYFNHWYTFICKENEGKYKQVIQDCIHFEYHLKNELQESNSTKDLARVIRDYFMFTLYSFQARRPLIKDPISLFSAPWLHETFNFHVITLIRHPAAFVGSLKKKQAKFPLEHFLEQPLLIDKYLKKYEDQIRNYINNPPNLIQQGILLWNIFHDVILTLKEENRPQWLFKRHEDLSRDPKREYKILYDSLRLDYTPAIESLIEKYSTSKKKGNNYVKRDSKQAIWSWKERLSTSEINLIRQETEHIANEFYDDKDW
jgi:hypothetical protein